MCNRLLGSRWNPLPVWHHNGLQKFLLFDAGRKEVLTENFAGLSCLHIRWMCMGCLRFSLVLEVWFSTLKNGREATPPDDEVSAIRETFTRMQMEQGLKGALSSKRVQVRKSKSLHTFALKNPKHCQQFLSRTQETWVCMKPFARRISTCMGSFNGDSGINQE